ncbi:MAG TPA: lactonase family protein [Devosiaceae bacterium]|jgi:6-phosphogluconolactonase|nr:lactonase family protein [Devosiaceae bacterium]
MSIKDLIYVGTYTEPILFGTGQLLEGKGRGIYCFRFDKAANRLELQHVKEGVRNPSYLAFDAPRRHLYCVNEFKEFEGKASGSVSAFSIDQETGALTYLNTKPSHGTDPCHLIVDKTGRFVLIANFASGSVCVLPILPDGSLGDETDFKQHQGSSVDPRRQTGPHAHAVEFDASGKFVYVPDLGMDQVVVYAFDTETGKLTPADVPAVKTRPGAGPRQLVMHPRGKYAYLINELDSTMTAFAFDAKTGALSELQTLSTLPAGGFEGVTSCAEVQITPNGRFLYGSNRGHNSIVIYSIDEATGRMTLVGHESTQGRIPRNFEVDPTGQYLIAANQDTDNLVLFDIDQATGELHPRGVTAEAGTPICVRFV